MRLRPYRAHGRLYSTLVEFTADEDDNTGTITLQNPITSDSVIVVRTIILAHNDDDGDGDNYFRFGKATAAWGVTPATIQKLNTEITARGIPYGDFGGDQDFTDIWFSGFVKYSKVFVVKPNILEDLMILPGESFQLWLDTFDLTFATMFQWEEFSY